jgi:nitrite reductase/ring-hydroxylating ferredoxin subunit
VTCDPLTKTERLCALSDVPEGGAHEVVATVHGASESLILLRRGDEVAAFLNVCPHAGRRLDWAPGRFLFEQGLLVCAAHGASFSVPEGRCVSGPCRGQSLTAVQVRVDAGEVRIVDDGAVPSRA